MKLFDLTASQNKVIEKVYPRCTSSCEILHPLDQRAALECANECSERNKMLYRMSNASSYASLGSFLILIFVIIIVIRNK